MLHNENWNITSIYNFAGGAFSQNGYSSPERPSRPSGLYGTPSFSHNDAARPSYSNGLSNQYPSSGQRPGTIPRDQETPRVEQGFQTPAQNGRQQLDQGFQSPSQGDQRFSPGGPGFEGQPRRPDEDGFGGQPDEGDYSAIPGEPEKDYPIFSYVPETSFRCDQQQYPGYYADVETRCQIFHICANNRTYDFICPNGTIFHQEYLVCVWWNQFDCESAPSLYEINANIYDYSITGAQQTGGIVVEAQQGAFGSRMPGQQEPSFPSQDTTGYSTEGQVTTPGFQSPATTGYTNGKSQVTGYPTKSNGYSSERPQQPEFSTRPQNGISSYPNDRSQGPGFATEGRLQQTGFGSRPQSNGYSNGKSTTSKPEEQITGYPRERPQGPNFETPRNEGGRYQNGYSNGRSQTPGYSSQQTGTERQYNQNGQGYPRERLQEPGYPTGPGPTPSSFQTTLNIQEGYFSTRSQGSGVPSSETQRPALTTIPGNQGYPLQQPGLPTTISPNYGYSEGTTQGVNQGYPSSRPSTMFKVPSTQSREYLPPYSN